MKLDDRDWKPIHIKQLFDRFEPGKGNGLVHLEQTDNGIPYIGATNRNNGVLCFVKYDDASRKMVQPGNCIGFIKNGDGAAGYAIYKQEPFISTSDVIYGYAKWINFYTGLFFVAAQDMIKQKYSHGYKRNAHHLKGDRVMLPVTDKGEPDYPFMEQYMREIEYKIVSEYQRHLKKTIKQMPPPNGHIGTPPKWKAFPIHDIFSFIQRGKRLKTDDHFPGMTAYVSSSAVNNGVDDFVGNKKGVRIFADCLTLANSGSVGTAFYHPYSFVASDHVTQLKGKSFNKYVYLFLATALSHSMTSKYSFNREINDSRLAREQIVLPVNASGEPDYNYMEQFMRTLEYKQTAKYRLYIRHLSRNAIPESPQKPCLPSVNRR